MPEKLNEWKQVHIGNVVSKSFYTNCYSQSEVAGVHTADPGLYDALTLDTWFDKRLSNSVKLITCSSVQQQSSNSQLGSFV